METLTDAPPSALPVRPLATVSEIRHRAELPVLVAFSLLTVLGLAVSVLLWFSGVVPGWLQYTILGVGAPLFAAVLIIRVTFRDNLANGIEVGPDQLPDLYRIYADLCDLMGFRAPPRLIIRNGNGTLNAFASKCTVSASYVVLFSDLVDLATELDDWETVRFVLAHELGHIRCGHVALWRMALRPFARLVRVEQFLTRAQEYTADRWAAQFFTDPARHLVVLYAGKRLYRHVDLDAHLGRVEAEQNSGWLRLANAMSTHPVGHRRLAALRAMSREGVSAHGRMF